MLKAPDSALVRSLRPSPNFGARKGGRGIDMIVLHYTGCPSAESACLWMCSPDSQVSAHYLVDEDGEIAQLVAEEARAWHAGAGHWAGEDDVNSCSIGIEIQNAGHAGAAEDGAAEGGVLPPYPARQMRAVAALVEDIMRRHGIAPERVVGHSDVAPLRKADPGEHFPWEMLARKGLALPVPEVELPAAVALDAAGARRLQELLAKIGYGVPVSGAVCDHTRAVIRAFQRRFMPKRVDGAADAQVLRMAEAVRDMLDARGRRAYI